MDTVLTEKPNLRAVREELGLSQAEFASYLGVSVRTIQSCEQGWRCPGPSVRKLVLFLLITHRRKGELRALSCWEANACPAERRERCLVHISGQGHLCWFLTGNVCETRTFATWKEKYAHCLKCAFFQKLLAEASVPPTLAV